MDCINKQIQMSKWSDITLKTIQNSISEKRWMHTIRVTDAAAKLASLWGGDVEKAVVASYCHDFSKELSEQQSDYYVRKYKLPEKFLHGSEIAHGHIAAAILADEYHMSDEDILNAIRYHSTGRPGMSMLEKIVYLADLIEDGRTYKGVEEIRRIAETSLDSACKMAFKEVMGFVRGKGKIPDLETQNALEYLLEKEYHMEKNEIKQIADIIVQKLEEKKGIDIISMDISVKSSFCDYFIVVTGSSDRQIKALSDEVEDKMAELGVVCKNIEGKSTGWILMDYGDIIVSIFTAAERERYDLEKIWNTDHTGPASEFLNDESGVTQ